MTSGREPHLGHNRMLVDVSGFIWCTPCAWNTKVKGRAPKFGCQLMLQRVFSWSCLPGCRVVALTQWGIKTEALKEIRDQVYTLLNWSWMVSTVSLGAMERSLYGYHPCSQKPSVTSIWICCFKSIQLWTKRPMHAELSLNSYRKYPHTMRTPTFIPQMWRLCFRAFAER